MKIGPFFCNVLPLSGSNGQKVITYTKKGGSDLAAFQEIYDEYGKPVYRFLLSLTGSPEQAEELLQETFFQALIHIDKFQGRSSLYTWLCQIGKNAWLKECRRSKRYADTPWEDLRLPDGNLTPEEAAIRKDELRRIRQAVRNLEEPYRDVFILHVYGGLKLKAIADLNGKSESWARVTFYRARMTITKEVTK